MTNEVAADERVTTINIEIGLFGSIAGRDAEVTAGGFFKKIDLDTIDSGRAVGSESWASVPKTKLP